MQPLPESPTDGLTPESTRVQLLGMTAEEFGQGGPLAQLPAYRARQIYKWLYQKGETRFEAMTDLPRELRSEFDRHYSLEPDPVVTAQRAQDDEAVKFLLRLHDGRHIETVLINTPQRKTICVSSQVGCAYGCTFCATAQMGAGRNLTPREILSQLVAVRGFMRDETMGTVHNVVFMGMGEPLANYRNLVATLRLMQDEDGLNIGWRRITVSTVGLEPQIRRLADGDVPVRLAYSLSATTDEVRSRLMPINRKYPFRKVLEALTYFRERRGTRPTLEYVLLHEINDSRDDARRLADLARGHGCKINLIVYNPHPAAPFAPSRHEAIQQFMDVVYPLAPSVTLRYSKGRDILAACGQLSTVWEETDDSPTPRQRSV